jgi:hypothetical protein
MSTYLVRLKDTKEAVGIFMAGDLNALWDSVDEVTSPTECEYRRLAGAGLAIHWKDSGAAMFGVNGVNPADGEDVNLDDLSNGITFSESLVEAILNEKAGWTPVPWPTVGPLAKLKP